MPKIRVVSFILLLSLLTIAVHAAVVKPAASDKTVLPIRVCVLDFSTIETKGDKRFLDQQSRPVEIPAQCTLNDADRKSVNGIMQGLVRLIDAWDNSKTNTENRQNQSTDNEVVIARAQDLYQTVVKGEARPAVIGAEYLTAYLGQNPQVFAGVEAAVVEAELKKLTKETNLAPDFLSRLGETCGVTHLIFGTVADLRRQEKTFEGYGITTKSTDYQLDVIIRLVDLKEQRVVYGKVYTGRYQERQPLSGSSVDSGIFQTLMKSALQQAAEDLTQVVKAKAESGKESASNQEQK